MESIELRTESREVRGKKVERLRASGWIPAVMYGPDTPARPIQIEERALYQTMQQAGSTALIALYVDKESSSNMVLARDIQRDILTSQILHVDFYQVRMTEKVKTTPRLVIVGKSPLVNAGGAVMIQAMTEVEVECLPTDLIDSIDVDVSGLETLDDNITISDLPVPDGVTILADPGDVVTSLVAPRLTLEEEEELEAEAELELEAEAEFEAEAEAEEEATAEE